MKILRYIQMILFVSAPVSIIIAFVLAAQTVFFLRSAKTAEGSVIESRAEVNSAGEITYYPYFTFKTFDGHDISTKADTGNNPRTFEDGQRVRVFYKPSSPNNAKIDSFSQLWSLPVNFGFIGLVHSLLSVLLLRLIRGRTRHVVKV